MAGGGGALYFVNRCHESVRLAITYRQTSGEWSTEAWWEFKPQEQGLLANDGEKLRSNHRIFYYYAEIPDAEYRWAGSEDNSNDRTRIVGERPYRFRQAELERNDNGDFTLALNCPNLS